MIKPSTIKFKLAFLAPKYWLFLLGLFIFRLILCLPYPILRQVGKFLSLAFRHLAIGKDRIKTAKRNLELCFPDYSAEKRQQILQQNIQNVGMAVIETGMAWFWPDQRIRKWTKINGLEHLQAQPNQGILLIGIHFLTLELGARIIGLEHPGIGVYRPNDDPLMDWLQITGRMRSNKAMIDRKDLRGMIKALRKGETLWYAPDHDYGKKNAVFVPFFAVPDAASTTGSYYLIKSVKNLKIVPFAPLRNQDGSGYSLEISAPVDFSDLDDETAIAIRMNQIIEKEILKGVDQYMWLHRRFKTRPQDGVNLYD